VSDSLITNLSCPQEIDNKHTKMQSIERSAPRNFFINSPYKIKNCVRRSTQKNAKIGKRFSSLPKKNWSLLSDMGIRTITAMAVATDFHRSFPKKLSEDLINFIINSKIDDVNAIHYCLVAKS
jgi:hypothetical protein